MDKLVLFITFSFFISDFFISDFFISGFFISGFFISDFFISSKCFTGILILVSYFLTNLLNVSNNFFSFIFLICIGLFIYAGGDIDILLSIDI